MPNACGGPGPRPPEQQARGLFIGSRLRSGQGYAPRNQAPFKMSKCVLLGIGGQRPVSRQQGVADQLLATQCSLGLGEVVGQLRGVVVSLGTI